VITDLGMPRVDGRAVAAGVKGVSPDTPVLLLTGWGQHLREGNEMPAGVDYMLNKPANLSELRAALAELVYAPA
jgi:DNA-binding response OmpR family regulator